MRLTFVILLFISLAYCYIDPVIDAERRAILPQFLDKVTGTREDGVNNLTVYATPDYCWDIAYSGSFCGAAAQDYVSILFVEVPYYNATSNTTTYYQLAYVNQLVLEIDLVNDGTLNDTYVVKYVNNETILDSSTYTYVTQAGLFYTAYYTFQKNSTLISVEVVISSEGSKFVQSSAAYADVNQLCLLITGLPGIFDGACPTGSIYQQYESYDDCVTTMTAINSQNMNRKGGACPDAQASNTTGCRYLHGNTALTDPPHSQIIHCPHAGTPSTICIDYCDSVCSSCDENAQCQYDVDIYGNRAYNCICNPGYIGNGTNCSAVPCTARYECGIGSYYNYADCNTTNNLCFCEPTFTWNPLTSRCECQGNFTVQYVNGSAICLEVGRCTERYHCTTAGYNSDGVQQLVIGGWNDLTCVAYGILTPLIPYNTCICNYGYTGGYFTECVCQTNRTLTWSSITNGNVCLGSNECTADWQCASGQTCNFTIGPAYGVGICNTSSKRGLHVNTK